MMNTILPSSLPDDDLTSGVYNADFGVVEFSLDGVVLAANDMSLSMFECARSDIIGKPHAALYSSAEGRESPFGVAWGGIKAGERKEGYFYLKRKNGTFFWANAVFLRMRSNKGVPETIVAFYKDVTDTMAGKSESIARLEAFNRSFIMASYSPEGVLLEVNDNFMKTLGRKSNDVVGMRLERVMRRYGMEKREFEKIWSRVEAGHAHFHRMHWVAANGDDIWLDSVFIPDFQDSQKLKGVFQVALEVSGEAAAGSENDRLMRTLSLAVDHTKNAVVITDSDGKTVYVNSQFTKMFGYGEEEVLGGLPTCIFGPREEEFFSMARKVFSKEEAYHSKEVAYCKNGRRMWVSTQFSPVFDAKGEREWVVGVFVDVTELKLLETLHGRALEDMARDMSSGQIFQHICEEIAQFVPGVHLVVYGLDPFGKLCVATASHNEFSCLGGDGWGVDGEPQFPSCKAAWEKNSIIENDLTLVEYPEHIKSFFTDLGVDACLAQPILSSNGRVLGVATFYREKSCGNTYGLGQLAKGIAQLCSVVMEREESRTNVRMLAFYDPVTSLPKRDLVLAKAERLTDSPEGTRFAVMAIKIDKFSRFNTAYDYEAGNEILNVTAKRLLEQKSPDDVVGRLVADVFVMLCVGCGGKEAFEKARRVQETLAKPFVVGGNEIVLSASIGVSLFPDNGASAETLMDRANSSLLQGKKREGGRIWFFSENLNVLARERLSLEMRLRKSIENQELYLCYQPQVSLQNGKIYGVEALCRWRDQEKGNIPPDVFIAMAEESGFINELSDWVLCEACRQLGQWRERNLPVPAVSINLSAPNFQNRYLPDRIMEKLREHALSTEDMLLELTESVLLGEDKTAMTTIDRAHTLGLALALDDFGTGYSSLRYLRDLPFSELKLDKSFITNVHKIDTDRDLIDAIMAVGRTLGLEVLAEGVESQEQYSLLQMQRCHAVQGYLVSKPLLPDDFETWARTWRPRAMLDQYCLVTN